MFLPFALQSNTLDLITSLDDSAFYEQCNHLTVNSKPNESHIFKKGQGSIATEDWLIKWANKFDRSSEMLPDTLMCSQICPCHSVRNISADGTRNDPAWDWERLSEADLNHYGRTHNKEATELVPLVFKAAREGTYDNFEDCLAYIKFNRDRHWAKMSDTWKQRAASEFE